MFKVVKGDVTKVFPNENKVIPHIVNSHGIMGSGVAYGLYQKWPKVKYEYYTWYDTVDFDLGEIQPLKVNENTYVINMVAQKLGIEVICGKVVPPIRLWALKECLLRVVDFMDDHPEYKIVAPKFGSLRSGGDWDKDIYPMIEKYWEGFDVTICEYEE